MPTTEEAQYAAEWRALILDKLKNLEAGQISIHSHLSTLQNSYASVTDVNEIKNDLEALKLYKAKVTGIIIALNTVAAVIGWMIQTFLHK